MAQFIKCSVAKVQSLCLIENHPVNIDHCASIAKSSFKEMPSIEFHYIAMEWVYPDEKSRDKDYERITNTNSVISFTEEEMKILKQIAGMTVRQRDLYKEGINIGE